MSGARQRGPRWLSVADPSWLRLGRTGNIAFLLIGCLLITAWHGLFIGNAPKLDNTYSASPGYRGTYIKRLPRWFYFYHYTGQFPITSTTTQDELREDAQAAQDLIAPRDYPSGLRNELYSVIRKGDLGQLFLLYPDYWRKGTTLDTTPRTFNRALALVASLFLFVGLSLTGHRMLAVLLVALLGSHPFQLLHHYLFVNVWAYPIAVACIALGICAPLLFAARPRRLHYLIPLLLGILFATAREVRTEPALLIASVGIVCITAHGSWARRALLVATLAVSFGLTSQLWARFWDTKFEEAVATVTAAGGKPLLSDRNLHHSFWHPLWHGLADFGWHKGYRKSDRQAYAYAIPIMNERYGTEYQHKLSQYYLRNKDEQGHRLKPETIPEYQLVLREKILTDIRDEPSWFLGVLLKRAERIFDRATPVRLGLGARFVDIPFSAWLVLPMLALLLFLRRWEQVKLLIFFSPTSLPAFLIHSGGGFTNPTAFHLAAFALFACWSVNALSGFAAARTRARA